MINRNGSGEGHDDAGQLWQQKTAILVADVVGYSRLAGNVAGHAPRSTDRRPDGYSDQSEDVISSGDSRNGSRYRRQRRP